MQGLDLKGEDFAFPGSSSPARALGRAHHVGGAPLRPFYSPLVVLARRPRGQRHVGDGPVPEDRGQGHHLAVAQGQRRVRRVEGHPEHRQHRPAGLQLRRPLPRHRRLSGQRQPDGQRRRGRIAAVTPLTRKLTAAQGSQKVNSEDLFDDFNTGVGTPLVFTYESQIAALLIRGDTVDDLVVLYPDTTVFSDHSLVPLTEKGRTFGELLKRETTLRKLAVRHGFRPEGDTSEFAAATAKHGTHLRQKLTGTVQQATVPTPEVMREIARRSRAQK